MQFQTLTLGGGNLAFSNTNSTRLPFQFPSPIAGAYAILQTTHFELTPNRGTYYNDDDVEVKVIEVSALALFDALQSNTGGEVQIAFSVPETGSATSPNMVFAEIKVLVVGV